MIHVLYHKQCDDGYAAALAAWLKFGDKAKYKAVAYGERVPPFQKQDTVYVLDFSFKRKQVQELVRRVAKVVVIDHHMTALTELHGMDCAIFSTTKAGAVMAWEYFHPDSPPPQLYLHLQDYDLWQFKLTGTKQIVAALRKVGRRNFKDWERLLHVPMDRLIGEGEVILQYQETLVREIADTAIVGPKARIAGYQVPIVNCSVLNSEVCEELIRRYPMARFVSTYVDRKDGLRKYSLRSKVTDVAQIAQKFGGGGHKSAAGFEVPSPKAEVGRCRKTPKRNKSGN